MEGYNNEAVMLRLRLSHIERVIKKSYRIHQIHHQIVVLLLKILNIVTSVYRIHYTVY